MAEVTITVKSDISDVEKDVTKLTRQLRDSKLAFKDLEKGTEEYAKKKTEIDALTKALNAQKDSLQDLKKESKKTADGFAEAKEKMNDLKDEAILLQGSGVERLKNSFGLLTDGIENADFDKVKTAFKGVGAAMAAIPIFLLVEGFKLLIENFDKVKEVTKVLFNSFSDGEIRVKSLTKELEKQQRINSTLISGLENEIKILEAQGQSSAKILQKKRELNALKIKELEIDAHLQLARVQEIKDNDTLVESYYRKSAAVLTSLGFEEKAAQIIKMIDKDKADRAKEALDKFKEDSKAIAALKTEDRVNEINFNKEQKALSKERAKDRRDEAEEAINIEREVRGKKRKLAADEAAIQKEIDDEKKKKEQEQEEERKKRREELRALQLQKDKEDVQAFLDNEETKKRASESRFNLEKSFVQSAQAISELFFQGQLAAAEGDEKRQLEIKKRAFNVNKAFQATQATIDGYRAVLSAYATAPPGFKIASSIAAGLFAGTQVARILAAKFNPGSTPSASSSSSPVNTSSGGGNGTPTGQQVPTNQPQQSTQFDANGNKIQPTKVIVLASDIKDVTRQVARVEEQSKF